MGRRFLCQVSREISTWILKFRLRTEKRRKISKLRIISEFTTRGMDIIFDFLSCVDLINLLNSSNFFQIIQNFQNSSKLFKYYNWGEKFCIAKEWQRVVDSNIDNLLLELFNNVLDDNCFCYDYLSLKFEKIKHHLSLFSVTFLRCGRNCDGLRKINCCFYCSRVRSRSFDIPSLFFGIIVEHFCKLVQKTTLIDLDIHADHPVVIECPNFAKTRCDFFQLYEYPQDIMNGLTGVLMRLF